MKKIIITISIIFSLIALSYSPINSAHKTNAQEDLKTANDVILRDDFDSRSSHWIWFEKWNANIEFNNGVAEFKIPGSFRFGHFDAEIYDKEKDPYLYNAFKTRIKVDPVLKGSRGWGFWNVIAIKYWCRIAWFIYLDGPFFYPYKGLYVQCVNGNPKNFTMIPIHGYDISEWHEYEINWKQNYVEFYIDGDLVANATKGVPNKNCRVDVWIDNAIWLKNSPILYMPIFLRFNKMTTLYLDYIEITE